MGMPSRQRQSATEGLYQPLAEINVTPLVDVMLVLLIIFMVTAPLLAKGVKVNLPQATAAMPINQKDPIVVTVGKEGKLALGADEISAESLFENIRVMMGEDHNVALPPPVVMAPDAVPLPAKKEDVDKIKKKVEEQQQVQRAQQRQEAQARRRAGAPEGQSGNSGASQATCLAHVAAALRRHTPGSTSLGPGHANVTFHVNPGGGLSGISASGSSPAHAALARRIVSSSRGPSICGSAYISQAFAFH